MKIEIVKTSSVKLNKANPRIIRDDRFAKLVKSVTDFPEMLKIRPIVVDNTMTVLGGNMRLRACIDAGLDQVPIIKASDLTDEQKQRFIIADNVGFGEWDWSALANEWDADNLQEWGLEVPGYFSQPSEDELTDDAKGKPPVMSITFPTIEDMDLCEPEIKNLLGRLSPGTIYSVSAGEI